MTGLLLPYFARLHGFTVRRSNKQIKERAEVNYQILSFWLLIAITSISRAEDGGFDDRGRHFKFAKMV